MAAQSDIFRDFGIIPEGVSPPLGTIRAYFSRGHVIGQYLMTCLMSGAGVGLAIFCGRTLSFPANILGASATLLGFGYIVYRATRDDYAWVDLDGETLRAKHLYTGRLVERSIEEIEDLLTLVFLVRSGPNLIVDAWVGRVRGILIRFNDQAHLAPGFSGRPRDEECRGTDRGRRLSNERTGRRRCRGD